MKSVTLQELARQIGGTVEGDGERVISGVAPIESAQPGDITFLSNPVYMKYIEDCRASALIASRELRVAFRPLLLTENPYLLFAKAVEFFHQDREIVTPSGIDPRASIDPTARIGEGVTVMAGAVVEAGASVGRGSILFPGVYVREGTVLGEKCVIHPRVTIEAECVLGDRTIVHSGTVIGNLAGGAEAEAGGRGAFPGVETGSDVEMGSNVIVNRGVRRPTTIGAGTKMDNLVQIGSEVQIGRCCLVVAQAGLGDGCILEDGVTVAGQVTVEPGLRIGRQAVVGARSLVTRNLAGGRVYSGVPARPHAQEKRIIACIGRLPNLYRRIQDLEQRIEPENDRETDLPPGDGASHGSGD